MKTLTGSEHESITRPIGLKIFGIAASLLFLMASVTYVTTRNLSKLSDHLNLLTTYFIPLDQTIGDIQFTQSAQRLVYDQMLRNGVPRSFASAQADAEKLITDAGGCSRDAITQASRTARDRFKVDAERDLVRYELYRSCGDREVKKAQEQIHHSLAQHFITADPENLRTLTQLDEKFKNFSQVRASLQTSVVRQFTDAHSKEQSVSAFLKTQVSDNRRLVNQNIREIILLLHTSTQEIASQSTALERRAFSFSWIVTIVAALIGLFYAALLTRSLVRPVRQLVLGVKAIQDGDLSTHLLVSTKDEIGMLTSSFNHMASELKEKEVIKDTFGKYLDPRIVKDILERASALKEGEKQVMTVQFSDIEGFTHICEQLTPEATVKFLNQYFSVMSAAILDQKGIIDKFIGDAVMGFWGVPFCEASQHATLACMAALDQVALLESFNQKLPDIIGVRKGLPRINIRIGLCTGEVIVGSLGSESSRSYTVIGDTVNQASRIESASKQYGTQIIINEGTRIMAADQIEVRELDLIIPAGKDEPVRIFELLGRKGLVNSIVLELRDAFEQGLQRYRVRDWQGALDCFERCLKIDPTDNPSKLFVVRVQQFLVSPPGSEWDGTWKQTK